MLVGSSNSAPRLDRRLSMRTVDAAPKAAVLIESMRDVGYSLETALADVIDNSIAAGATAVEVHVDSVSAEAKIAVADNGKGMTAAELVEAMRLGSRHPREKRSRHDLGRFGLGLKTASFSQCRRLTVVSRKNRQTAVAIWDLDHIANAQEWSLQLPESTDDVPFAERLGDEGSLVVWEVLDRAVEQSGSDAARKHFVRRIAETIEHLELVFHRYLSGERGLRRISITVNDTPLKPFDPFHASHPATIVGQPESISLGDCTVEIQPFTLPHYRNVTEEQWRRYAGKAGYLKNQGFYLYRERRLIMYGTWFGLARQTELTQLSRVRIDMPNGLDEVWHVDVKKASARPPLPVRERLQAIIEQLGAPSRRVFIHRGQKLDRQRVALWSRVKKENAIIYRPNDDHPLIGALGSSLSDGQRKELQQLLQALGAALPLDALLADLGNTPEAVVAEAITDESLESILRTTISELRKAGTDPSIIPDMLWVSEPFRSNWERVEPKLDKMLKAG